MKLSTIFLLPFLLLACSAEPEASRTNIHFGAYESEDPDSWWAARPEIGFRVSEDRSMNIQVDPPPCGESALSELWGFDGDSWNLEASFEGGLVVRLSSESEYVIATDSSGCFVPPDVRPLYFRLTISELP